MGHSLNLLGKLFQSTGPLLLICVLEKLYKEEYTICWHFLFICPGMEILVPISFGIRFLLFVVVFYIRSKSGV